MSFTDPIAVAAQSPYYPALTLTRVDQGGFKSKWLDIANGYTLEVEHSDPSDRGKKQERHYARVSFTKNVTLLNGSVVPSTISCSISMSVPPQGWVAADKVAISYALRYILTDAEVTWERWVNFES